MTEEQISLLRRNLLVQLAHGPRSGLGLKTLGLGLAAEGFDDLREEVVIRHLDYLTKQLYVSEHPGDLNARNPRYQLTDKGLDHLRENGLI